MSLWCFGPLSDGSCFRPSPPREGEMPGKWGTRGPRAQNPTQEVHAIGVMSSAVRASPRDRGPGSAALGVGGVDRGFQCTEAGQLNGVARRTTAMLIKKEKRHC